MYVVVETRCTSLQWLFSRREFHCSLVALRNQFGLLMNKLIL